MGSDAFTTGSGPGAPAISQAWLDRYQLKLDLVDANAERFDVRLDTRRRRGWAYTGTLVHRGRTWRVRCDEEG